MFCSESFNDNKVLDSCGGHEMYLFMDMSRIIRTLLQRKLLPHDVQCFICERHETMEVGRGSDPY